MCRLRTVVGSILLLVSAGLASDENSRTGDRGVLSSTIPTSTLLNINQISVWARNDGWSARDPATGNAGLMFPRGKVAAVFADGILWGGRVLDSRSQVIRVGGQSYSIGTVPGRIVSRGISADTSDRSIRMFRIRADFRTADLRLDAAELNRIALDEVTPAMVATVRQQYERDWSEWPWQQGAPFYDANSNGVRDLGEAPGLANADQVVWYIANDLNEGKTQALFGSQPIGLEMQVTIWGYRTDQPPWSSTILKRVKVIYKGTATTADTARIDSMFIAQWSDPDLGNGGDDFAGCDTTLGLNYVYNAGSSDVEYARFGLQPPAIGYQFVQTPVTVGASSDSAIVNQHYVYGKKHVPIYSMTYALPSFGGPGIPRATDYFNLLKGLDYFLGRPYVHPRFPGDTTRFWLDGDPVSGTGRLDSIPGDRRILAAAGPFTMALGDTQEVVIATIGSAWSSNIQSVWQLRRIARTVQSDFEDLLEGLGASPDSTYANPPSRFHLNQNYPNPFNPVTTFTYDIGYKVKVLVRVYDILGREVARLVDEVKEPGAYEVSWDGSRFSSGVYVFSIDAGPYSRSMKAILVK